jgi:hypothetical protein
MKETRNPITVELKPMVFDHPGNTRGRLIYYYSARRKIDPADTALKRKLTQNGFYHIKKRNLRNGKIIFLKKAKIIIEVTETTVFGEKVYKEDISSKIRSYIGEKISPVAVEKLAHKINKERVIKPILIEGRVYLLPNKFY